MSQKSTVYLGDVLTVLPTLPDESVDAVVTDPPYALGFMGQAWDTHTPGGFQHWCELWAKEALRVLKPGGHLLAFGGTRTYHRLTSGIEDAGFEIRDSLHWLYGSGFPKSHNLKGDHEGWGTALKPAHEPIVLARKPLQGTVAANVLQHGTGALNIDGCRVYTDWSERPDSWKRSGNSAKPEADKIAAPPGAGINCHPAGRWPANVLLDDVAAGLLDEQSGERKGFASQRDLRDTPSAYFGADKAPGSREGYNDTGGASRFFPVFKYQAKASKRERPSVNGVKHPTVKPVELMRWLVRLITPPNGLVLDPFAGSGATLEAAHLEGMESIGVERELDYCWLIKDRLARADVPVLFTQAQTGVAS